MSYFLFKTEPDVYSFVDFLRDKETIWDNVTKSHRREVPARDEGGDEVDF